MVILVCVRQAFPRCCTPSSPISPPPMAYRGDLACQSCGDIARAASNTFAGIRPDNVAAFVVAQLLGAAAATLVLSLAAPSAVADRLIACSPRRSVAMTETDAHPACSFSARITRRAVRSPRRSCTTTR